MLERFQQISLLWTGRQLELIRDIEDSVVEFESINLIDTCIPIL